jgi:hypothetical protein
MAKTTEIKPEDLKDFELKFYEGMQRFGETTEETMGIKIIKCIPKKDKNNNISVELVLNTKDDSISTTKIMNEIKKMLSHFVVFYTPAHYRIPPTFVVKKLKYKDEVAITGYYAE